MTKLDKNYVTSLKTQTAIMGNQESVEKKSDTAIKHEDTARKKSRTKTDTSQHKKQFFSTVLALLGPLFLQKALSQRQFQRTVGYLQKFAESLHGEPRPSVTESDSVFANMRCMRVEAGTPIYTKGEDSKGIFILLDGVVNVTTTEGDLPITTMSTGDIFGEISTLFGLRCTVNIRAQTSCTLAHLAADYARDLLGDPGCDVIDWFVKKRYLPTSMEIDSNRVYRRLALTCLQDLPMFCGWSEMAVKTLILLLNNPPVIVYDVNTAIVMETDPACAVHVVLRGQLEVYSGERCIHQFTISCESSPLVIGEMELCLGEKTVGKGVSAITVKAVSCCHVITIGREHMAEVVKRYPDTEYDWVDRWLRWTTLLKVWGPLYHRHKADLQPEMVMYSVMSDPAFRHLSWAVLEDLMQKSSLQQVEAGTSSTEWETDKYAGGYLVSGILHVEVTDHLGMELTTVTDGQPFALTDNLSITATTSSIIILIGKQDGSDVNNSMGGETVDPFI